MKFIFLAVFINLFIFSCAPVKFSKSSTYTDTTVNEQSTISCDPKFSTSVTTYTYGSTSHPSIVSQCDKSSLNYTWTIKNSNSEVISTSVTNLSGANPNEVHFSDLGVGIYYVFLTASDPNGKYLSFTATTPLEVVVPGDGVGNSLTCDPKINSTFTTLNLNSTDSNPIISANCSPAASQYIWVVTKDNSSIILPGLSGESSTPNFFTNGVGAYKISLYAIASGSAHWQSSTPLAVNVLSVPDTSLPTISCNPNINGSTDSVTLTSTSSFPLVSSNCTPSDGTYTWTVKKSGVTVSLPTLTGENSNPDFFSLGSGVYLVYLKTEKTGYQTWNTTDPLVVTVDTTAQGQVVNCAPRFNSGDVTLTIEPTAANPTLSANCTPNSASVTWAVFKNNSQVTVADLSGATSTPNFTALGLGTYYVYMTATQANYSTFVLASPLMLTIANSVPAYRTVTFSKTVTATDNKVDIALIVDDSNSMLADNRKLAQKLEGFVSSLTSVGLDWQMCATVTRSQDVKGDGVYYWGASRNWVNYVGSQKWILKAGATDPYSIFTSTIEAIGAGWANSDDERAIKAAYIHATYNPYNYCYRTDAAMSVIIISDEDERSVGGDASQVYYGTELKTLEADDTPEYFVNGIKQLFGLNKKFTVNSIIVKPGDTSCMASQDASGAKSHYGKMYAKLSDLTQGSVTSICESNYSTNLNYFKESIVKSLNSINLECAPLDGVTVNVEPSLEGMTFTLEDKVLKFTPQIPIGHTLNVTYKCAN